MSSETVLRSDAKAGTKVLDVLSTDGFAIGDRVFIEHTAYSESKVIESIGTHSLTLETTLWRLYYEGSSVSASTRNKKQKHTPKHRTSSKKSCTKNDLEAASQMLLAHSMQMSMGWHMGMSMPMMGVLGAPRIGNIHHLEAADVESTSGTSSSGVQVKCTDTHEEGAIPSDRVRRRDRSHAFVPGPSQAPNLIAGAPSSQAFPSQAPQLDLEKIHDPYFSPGSTSSQAFAPRPSQAPNLSTPRIDAKRHRKDMHIDTRQDVVWLKSWLCSLDQHGTMLQYFPQLERNFRYENELAELARPVQNGGSVLHAVDPAIFDLLGIKPLGHKLLLAKGIAALDARSEKV